MSVRVLAVGDPAVYGYVEPESAILDRFLSRSGIKTVFDILPWDEYGARLFEVVAQKEPEYDIVMVAGHLWLAQFVERGYLENLDGYAALRSEHYNPGDIHPAVATEMRYRGSSWLVPSFTDGHILYVQSSVADILDREDIVDPRRYLASAEAVAKADMRYRAPLVMKIAPSEIFLDWLPYLYAFGGECFGPSGEPLFADSAGKEALEYYLQLQGFLSKSHAPYGNEEVANALKNAEVGFGFSWGGQAGAIVTAKHVSEKRFVFETPQDPWNVTWSFGVLASSLRKSEAVELLAYLSSPEVDRLVGVRAGSPTRVSTYQDSALRERCPWFDAQELLLERARCLPSLENLGLLIAPLYTELTRASRGECGAGAALRAAQEQVETILDA